MTVCFEVKNHMNLSGTCEYIMLEVRYSSRKERKYCIKKYVFGEYDKQIVMPVTRETAEAVWDELEKNDWKS